MSTNFEDLIIRDIAGNRPAFGIPGRLFFDTTNGKMQRDNGAAWQDVEGTGGGVVRESVFTVEGALTVAAGVIRIYNKLGFAVTISQVFISVNTAPTGASGILVDVNKNGTTIFTNQANRPTITGTNFTGTTTTIDVASLSDGDYLTADVDQVGSTIAGSNLTVHVIYS